jgi:hypothetical protein
MNEKSDKDDQIESRAYDLAEQIRSRFDYQNLPRTYWNVSQFDELKKVIANFLVKSEPTPTRHDPQLEKTRDAEFEKWNNSAASIGHGTRAKEVWDKAYDTALNIGEKSNQMPEPPKSQGDENLSERGDFEKWAADKSFNLRRNSTTTIGFDYTDPLTEHYWQCWLAASGVPKNNELNESSSPPEKQQKQPEKKASTLENCGPEDVEFNQKWHLASANRMSAYGKPYARPGESITTGNVGAWYDTACYWRIEAEKELNRYNGLKDKVLKEAYEIHVRETKEKKKKIQCYKPVDRTKPSWWDCHNQTR